MDNLTKKSFRLKVSESIGEVSVLLYLPDNAEQVMLFAHGAGGEIKSKFMEQVSVNLAELGIATFRFNFPYMEKGKKIPDSKIICLQTIKAAEEKAQQLCPELPQFAAGKSFGGRMTSTAASEGLIEAVNGIIFFGFPLHAPGKPSNERAMHLYNIKIPMLFLQGTNDALANLDLLKPVIKKLKDKAELFEIEGADHSFHVPKNSKFNDKEVIESLCREAKRWVGTKL